MLLGLFFVSVLAGGSAADQGIAKAAVIAAPTPPHNQSVQFATTAEQRVLSIAYRLAASGSRECAEHVPLDGLLIRHIGQFSLADRARAATQFGLDEGPLVAAIVSQSPAAAAGVAPGDLLTAINGEAVAPFAGAGRPYDQRDAQAYSDRLHTMFARTAIDGRVRVSLLRNGHADNVDYAPVMGCASIVHLARSNQRNAFADGQHVFITTEIADLARDDNELAFVVAHEMAHNILHHAARLRSTRVEHGLLRGVGRKGRIVRETERQADLLGADLMLDAGFDTLRGVGVIGEVDHDPFRIGLLDDHDSTKRRVAAIREHIAQRLASRSAAAMQSGNSR